MIKANQLAAIDWCAIPKTYEVPRAGHAVKDNCIEACMEGLFMHGSIFHAHDRIVNQTFLRSGASRLPDNAERVDGTR
jgi:hypothetical protein